MIGGGYYVTLEYFIEPTEYLGHLAQSSRRTTGGRIEDQESRPELRSPRRALGREIEPCGGRSNLAGIGPETSEMSANEAEGIRLN